MKYSLRIKLFSLFFCLIVFSVVLTLLLNSTLLEKYYFNEKKDDMLQSYQIIQKAYKDDADNIMLDIEKIESLRGLMIIIYDKDLEAIYQSRQRIGGFRDDKQTENKVPPTRESYIEWSNLFKNIENLQIDKPITEIRYDKRMDTNFVSLHGKIQEGVYLYLGAPIKTIQDSAKIAKKFSIYTGFLTIILGANIIFLLTSRTIKPIIKLNEIAKKMAVLDFSEKYDSGNKRDEIATLGESINSLSTQLEKSIRELREANDKLMQDIERKREIDEMRKGFISNVSHELKTPIALVQGYAEGLKLNVNEDEENKNYYCEVIIDEAAKMNNMVKQLLELSELEFNEIQLDREDFNLNDMILNVIKKNSIRLTEKNAEVVLNQNGYKSLQVNADYYLIEQVLTNYMSNAMNHLDEKRKIIIDIRQIENKARVEVFNSGKNIPDDALENIWTSFYKVDKSRTRAYGGTGLGLSIVKATQNAHKNEYGVENKKEGVMFWFDVDISDDV